MTDAISPSPARRSGDAESTAVDHSALDGAESIHTGQDMGELYTAMAGEAKKHGETGTGLPHHY